LLLPISFSAHRGEKERRAIAEKVKEIEEKYPHDPVMVRQEVKRIFKTNRRIVVAEMISLFIQLTVALILWRIFGTGLVGEDIHLLYPWMPEVAFPYNLTFLGHDLTHPDWQLNLIQSVLIFVLESLGMYLSPYAVRRGEVVRMQLILPIVSFIIFSQLPAGKKLFMIVTLTFSILIAIFLAIRKKVADIKERIEAKEKETQEEKVLVQVQ
jgi:membrane protein insertase Oxa1/YidC/SpoIIIJ